MRLLFFNDMLQLRDAVSKLTTYAAEWFACL